MEPHRNWFLLAMGTVLVCLGASSSLAAVYYAAPSGTSEGAGSLDDPYNAETAVGKARSGDEVRLLDGTYYLTVPAVAASTFHNGVLQPQGGVTVRGWIADGDKPALGELRDRVVLDTQQTGRCFYMDNANSWWVIRDLVVTNACPPRRESDKYSYWYGGGLFLTGSSESLVTNCAFRGCVPGYCIYGGGAGARLGGSAVMVDCLFSGNSGDMDGIGLRLEGDAVVRHCVFQGNEVTGAQKKGVVRCAGGYLYDCAFTNNMSVGYGGALSGSPKVCERCDFFCNEADRQGGAVYVDVDSVTSRFDTCTFRCNRQLLDLEGQFGGGAFQVAGSAMPYLTNCTFVANTAAMRGGGISVHSGAPTTKTCGIGIADCRFFDNRAYRGGAVSIESYSPGLFITDCVFSNNENCAVMTHGPYPIGSALRLPFTRCRFLDNRWPSWYGGAVSVYYDSWTHFGSVLSFTDCTFERNLSRGGGAVEGWGVFTNCTFACNMATNVNNAADSGGKGGAVYTYCQYVSPATVPEATNLTAFVGCTFSNNFCHGFVGSAVAGEKFGRLVFEDCTVVENELTQKIGTGGGAITLSTDNDGLLVDRCRFERNTSVGYGAAIAVPQSDSSKLVDATIRNSLFVGNTNTSDYAGALALTKNCHVLSCTFVRNKSSGSNGAIWARSTENADVRNCIFYGNRTWLPEPADGDVGGEVFRMNNVSNCCTSLKYFNTDPAFGNIQSADPLFVDLEGGDYGLQKGSPCVDAGVNEPWMTGARDLRNKRKFPRIYRPGKCDDGIVDIGCYEYRPTPGLLLMVK